MPIGRALVTNTVGTDYNRDAMYEYVKSFCDRNAAICNESGGYDLLDEPYKTLKRPAKEAWKKFWMESFYDEDSIGTDPLMTKQNVSDQKRMMEQQFDNDVQAVYENMNMGLMMPVIGMAFPLHKNILMNMVFDKGAIQKVVAEGPAINLTMETRILRDTQGNEIDMFLEQNKMTAAIDASNPVYNIEINLPEMETTNVLALCGGTVHDAMSIKTHVCAVKLANVYIAEGDKLPDETGTITSKSKVATTSEAKLYDFVWLPINLEFKPGYNKYARSFNQPLSFTVRKSATEVEERKDALAGSMDHNKFTMYSTGNIKAVRLAAELDTSNAMLDTCKVSWKADSTLVEIPNAIPLSVTISPEEVKDLAALYQVNQLTKVMSLLKTVLSNYKDDKIREYLDNSYDRLPDRCKGYDEFDYAPPEGYALDYVEHRYKTFFDFFDSQVTHMLQVLNDPNMVVTIFGDPDLIRKITPAKYTYQSPDAIGPVDLDYKRTVVTSDNRVYQFIGSDKLRWTDQLICILCPRNSNRVTYRIYDYQLYLSNEIRDAANPALPAIHTFERWLINEYQPVQTRIKILNRTGRRPKTA